MATLKEITDRMPKPRPAGDFVREMRDDERYSLLMSDASVVVAGADEQAGNGPGAVCGATLATLDKRLAEAV